MSTKGDSKAPHPKKIAAEVLKVSVEKIEINAAEELKALAGISRLPLSKSTMKIELRGVPTAFANGLRRAMVDEMKGKCLSIGKSLGAAGSTDPFLFDQFVRDRIMQIPLRPQVSKDVIKDVRFAIHKVNKTPSDMIVYSGDMEIVKGNLTEPIFNPTFEVGFLQPGHALHVEDIHISEGYGRDFGGYQVACRGALRHLDIKQAPREQTHSMNAPLADESGYAISCMVADPRHHEISVVIPATGDNPGEAVSVAVDACINIKERLRLIQNALDKVAKAPGGKQLGAGIQFTLIDLEAGQSQGVLWVGGETHTIGNMVARVVHEQVPDVSYVGYTCIRHENGIRITVRHTGDVPEIIMEAIRSCYNTMDAIQKGINGATVSKK